MFTMLLLCVYLPIFDIFMTKLFSISPENVAEVAKPKGRAGSKNTQNTQPVCQLPNLLPSIVCLVQVVEL